MKTKILLIILILFLSSVSKAETNFFKLGFNISYNDGSYESKIYDGQDYQINNDFKKNSFNSFLVKFENGLPYVPNILIEKQDIKIVLSSGSNPTLDISNTNIVVYYSFKPAVLEFQVGIINNKFDIGKEPSLQGIDSIGFFSKVSLDPLLPITPSLIYSKGFGKNNVENIALGINYTLFPGFYMDLGVKNITYNYELSAFKDKDFYYKAKNIAYLGFGFNLGF